MLAFRQHELSALAVEQSVVHRNLFKARKTLKYPALWGDVTRAVSLVTPTLYPALKSNLCIALRVIMLPSENIS